MRKTKLIIFTLAAACMLSSCGMPGTKEVPPTPPVAPTELQQPIQTSKQSVISVSFPETVEKYYAPDVSDLAIVSFSYLTPKVRIEGNDAAADKINETIALQSEFFYSGNEKYIGVSGYHEMALDAYSYAKETGENVGYEMYAERKASAEVCNETSISLRFTVSSYLGGANEEYSIEGMTFDTASGTQLSLTDVIADQSAFQKIFHEACQNWQKNSGTSQELLPAGTEASYLSSCQWYLGRDGLTVIVDSEEIRSAVYAPVELNISYSKLKDCMNSRYMPAQTASTGTLAVNALSNIPNGTVQILDRVVSADNGTELILTAQGTVKDVAVYKVVFSEDTFFKTGSVWYANDLTDCGVQIVAVIPEGIPNLMICCTGTDGTQKEYILTQSGTDGTFQLSENIEILG